MTCVLSPTQSPNFPFQTFAPDSANKKTLSPPPFEGGNENKKNPRKRVRSSQLEQSAQKRARQSDEVVVNRARAQLSRDRHRKLRRKREEAEAETDFNRSLKRLCEETPPPAEASTCMEMVPVHQPGSLGFVLGSSSSPEPPAIVSNFVKQEMRLKLFEPRLPNQGGFQAILNAPGNGMMVPWVTNEQREAHLAMARSGMQPCQQVSVHLDASHQSMHESGDDDELSFITPGAQKMMEQEARENALRKSLASMEVEQ